ncbi:glutaminase [Actinomycetospora sp. NBRC 106375]|uniref:glutaminase A n=1 Tax=Actinomycetospora sp. NBRC 106375 TaxID=3032207 RepID=UPI0024A1102C|nr:glutaminase A [Actinomycetospora sp. NBRC 106375]GLZ44919.1 glutaminase [Actinomycetospora sp. NBRC 106375]
MAAPGEPELIRTQLDEIHERFRTYGTEEVVSYYPPEAEADGALFGVAGTNVRGMQWQAGDCSVPFPLHSVSKVFTYGLALEDNGAAATLRRVGVEPSGDPFNSITFDEVHHRPYNPMINAGALVAADLVAGRDVDEKVDRILERYRSYAGNPDLAVDQRILRQQLRSNDRNLGLCYIMRSLGMITGDIEEVVETYLSACSITVTAADLSVMGATLANGGTNPLTGHRAVPREHVRDIVSVMMTCGMYDAAGQWATDVGIPAKSGVSGDIVCVLPRYFGFGVYSPGLDVHGNSVRGVALCRELSATFGLHVFADPEDARFGRPSVPLSPRDATTGTG